MARVCCGAGYLVATACKPGHVRKPRPQLVGSAELAHFHRIRGIEDVDDVRPPPSQIEKTGLKTVHAGEQRQLEECFEQAARDRALALEIGIDASVEVLQSIRSLFGASMVVEREEFRSFVACVLT